MPVVQIISNPKRILKCHQTTMKPKPFKTAVLGLPVTTGLIK